MDRGRWIGGLGAALIAVASVGLTVVQYRMPESPRFPGPVYAQGARDYAEFLLGRPEATLPLPAFVAIFAAAMLLMWTGYGALLYSAYTRGVRHPWRLFCLAVAVSIMLAVAFPTSLTHDLFAYLGFARMGPVHGLNPYATTLEHLAAAGDPAAARYPAPHASVYGPAWTLVSSGLASVLRSTPLMAQAMVLKLVEAVALAMGALAARSTAERTVRGTGDLALLAFAFNPLLLLEGPGNGHIDVLMIAVLVCGLALLARGAWRTGFAVVGLSIAVKFVTIAIVPLLLVRELSGRGRSGAATGAEAAALSLLPLVITAVPYLTDSDPLAATAWLFGSRAHAAGGTILNIALLAGLYAGALVWLARAPRERGRVTAAWTSWSALSLHFAFPGTLPWYFAWPVGVSATEWDRSGAAVNVACALLALRWMLSYVILR